MCSPQSGPLRDVYGVTQRDTVRDTQRGTQSYMEKRRGRKETELTRRIKVGIKRREADLASNRFPKCSLQPGTQTDSQICVEKRSGREGYRGNLVEKKEIKKGERAIRPVTLHPSKNGY